MTLKHKDIYTKFMIEYDKANVTSSYPSLTEYEVATVLDKAYNALIAQKVTGNNVRRVSFESDIKSISDIQPLIKTNSYGVYKDSNMPENVRYYQLPQDFLYYVQSNIEVGNTIRNSMRYETTKIFNNSSYMIGSPLVHSNGFIINIEDFIQNENGRIVLDGQYKIYKADKLAATMILKVSELSSGNNTYTISLEDIAEIQNYDSENKCVFVETDSTIAYFQKSVEISTSGIEYDGVHNRSLPIKLVTHQMAEQFFITPYNMPWIKNPVCYIEDNKVYVVYDSIDQPDFTKSVRLSYIAKPNEFVKDLTSFSSGSSYFSGDGGQIDFECNSTVAEELVSLAVAFALENIESQRLNSKLNMRGLEA